MTYVDAWLRAFALTLAVETPLATALLGADLPVTRRLELVVIANLATHPLFWFALPELLGNVLRLSFWPRTLAGELCVWGVEAWIYVVTRAAPLRRACGVSFVANLASFLLGFTLWK